MEQPFYAERLAEHGVQVVIPGEAERERLHQIIFDELCAGDVPAASQAYARGVIAQVQDEGATAIALACTELMLLLKPEDSALPLFDTTALHCAAAVDFALSD